MGQVFKDGDVVYLGDRFFRLREYTPVILQPARDTGAEMARIADIYPFPDAREPKSSTQPATDSPDPPSPGSGSSHRADNKADDESQEVDEEIQQASDSAGGGGGAGAPRDASEDSPPDCDSQSGGSAQQADDDIDVIGLGSWVANHLKKNSLTQTAFAKKVEVHAPDISNLINGRYVGPAVITKINAFMLALESEAEGVEPAEEFCLKQTVLKHLDSRGIEAGDAAEYFGIRQASFLGIINDGPPPLEDTVFAIAAKIPDVAGRIDELLAAREAWVEDHGSDR